MDRAKGPYGFFWKCPHCNKNYRDKNGMPDFPRSIPILLSKSHFINRKRGDDQMDEPNKSTDPIAAACDNEVNDILKEDDEAANEEKTDTAPDNTDVEKDASSNSDECDSDNQNDDLAEEINLNDIEELAEAINGIHDKVTVIENDQTNFIRNTQQRLEEIDNNIKSLMVSLQEIAEQPQQLNELSQSLLKTSSNINTSVTNLQTAFNGINESTTQCIRELQTAANEIPKNC